MQLCGRGLEARARILSFNWRKVLFSKLSRLFLAEGIISMFRACERIGLPFGVPDLRPVQGATRAVCPLRHITEEQRRNGPKMGLPEACPPAGRGQAAFGLCLRRLSLAYHLGYATLFAPCLAPKSPPANVNLILLQPLSSMNRATTVVYFCSCLIYEAFLVCGFLKGGKDTF